MLTKLSQTNWKKGRGLGELLISAKCVGTVISVSDSDGKEAHSLILKCY